MCFPATAKVSRDNTSRPLLLCIRMASTKSETGISNIRQEWEQARAGIFQLSML